MAMIRVLSIGIDCQQQSIDKLISIGIDWLQIEGIGE